jgi:hypothetical protein
VTDACERCCAAGQAILDSRFLILDFRLKDNGHSAGSVLRTRTMPAAQPFLFKSKIRNQKSKMVMAL